MYASHLINRSTAIGGKTPLEIWSGKAAQDHGLLREFESPTFCAKDGMVNPRAKKFVFLGVKRNMKGYRLWDLQVMGPRKQDDRIKSACHV